MEETLKRVLIIASFYPYMQGSKRVMGLAKYLPQFGWQPTILTPGFPTDTPYQVIKTEYHDTNESFIRMKSRLHIPQWLSTIGGMVLNYPDAYKCWHDIGIKSGMDYMWNNKVKAILSIWPVTSHLIASELKGKYKTWWVADYPDLWSQNVYYPYGIFRRILDRMEERYVIHDANILTTTSEVWADRLRLLHRGHIVESITHGYDPQEYTRDKRLLTGKLTLTYTGMFYRGLRDPSTFIRALSELIKSGSILREDVEVRLYGVDDRWVRDLIGKYELKDVVIMIGRLPHKDIIIRQKESQVLLFFDWDNPKETGVYTGKIFEYLGAQRPILSIGGVKGNVVGELLDKTGTGIQAVTCDDMKAALLNYYNQYKQDGYVRYHGRYSEISRYSQVEMARKFAQVLTC